MHLQRLKVWPPGIIQNSFGKLKGYGLFEMDKAIKNVSITMGL
jgi:hypothetical protein